MYQQKTLMPTADEGSQTVRDLVGSETSHCRSATQLPPRVTSTLLQKSYSHSYARRCPKRATMFKALTDYIMPRLSPFREGDSFQLQITFYKSRYAEEIGAEFAIGIKYDAEDDGTINDSDYFEASQDRLYR